ncbi:hypothetical protein LINGRAHAP2_LOCUS19387 [Linum grandiflorum]
MSAVDGGGGRESLAGLTLDAILGNDKRSGVGAPPPTAQVTAATAAQMNRTLLDIIRDEDPHRSLFGGKDKKSWKAFRERLRLRRAGAAWTSTVHVPTSDLPVHNNRSSSTTAPRSLMMSRRNSIRFTTVSNSDSAAQQPQMSRRSSTRYGSPADRDEFTADTPAVGDGDIPSRSFRPTTSSSARPQSVRMHDEEEEAAAASHGSRRLGAALAEERALSAREAIAAQEAAEAANSSTTAAAAVEEEEEEEEEEYGDAGDGEVEEVGERGMGISLMDLLEETDRQMGFEGARYVVGEEDEQNHYYDEEDDDGGGGGGGTEHACCVCMVRHKGAALIPCGHTFCRLCSRELWVQRGNCPLCNGFILEILDIF